MAKTKGRFNVVGPPMKLGRFKCCDHCGVNYPDTGDSICNTEPDGHLVACNEPGCVKGKEKSQ